MLDKNFIAMTNYAMFAATGVCGEVDKDIDLSSVLKYASEQAIFPLVAEGIVKCGNVPSKEFSEYIQTLSLQVVAKNIQNSYIIKNIFEEFTKNNINYALLKGESIAVLYNEPDLRISGDVDILVSKKDEKKALKILEKFDYYYEKRPFWGNETVAKHSKYKMIEVHIALFDESRNDIFFKNVINEPESFSSIDSSNLGKISVLSPNDGIMFVFLHFVKHFLSSGAGVRQLIDVIVYAKHYINEIDWKIFFDKLTEMRYYKLFEYLVSIAVLYFGFSKDCMPKVNIDGMHAQKILEDLQYSGIFGYNEKELLNFKQVYEKKRFETYMMGNYDAYARRYKKAVLNLIFPPTSYMKQKYPYVKKCQLLIVCAYVHRGFNAFVKIFYKKRKLSDYKNDTIVVENKKINDRMKFMEDMGLI